ncbi:hypothetical protein SLS62_006754 [Diatrype stigma]|uniref:Uncharacterized protein n=1 Tax=Diatrype stigma TaxID=117547 RepID=A0AAN9UPD0_9PEZI
MPTDSSDPPGDDDYRRKNRFIRFKDHVDNKIYRGYEIWSSLLWSPSPSSSPSRPDKGTQNSSSPPSSPYTPTSTPSSLSSTPSPLPVASLDEVLSTSSFPNPRHPRLPIDKDGHQGPGTVEEVYNWAVNSPYSPLNLQHLRQPVPRDLTQHDAPHVFQYSFSFTFPPWSSSSDSSPWSFPSSPSSDSSFSSSPDPQFTFRDAFTDLLWYTMWHHLPDLQDTQRRWGFSGSRPEQGLHVADWTAYLGYHGLWYVYFPRLFDRMHLTPGLHPDRTPELLFQGPDHWVRVCERLRGDIENATFTPRLWFKPTSGDGRGGGVGNAFRGWDKVWGWGQKREVFATAAAAAAAAEAAAAAADIDEAFKTLHDRKYGVMSPSRSPSTLSPQSEVEEDLYNSLATNLRDTGDQQPKAIASSSSRNSSRNNAATAATSEKAQEDHEIPSFETTETIENSDGGKTVKAIRHDVDKTNGQIKVVTTITTKRYDAKGNLISNESHMTRRREWSSLNSPSSFSFPSYAWGRSSSSESSSGSGGGYSHHSLIPFDVWVASHGPWRDFKAENTGTLTERTKTQQQQEEVDSEQKQREAREAYWTSVEKIRQQEGNNKKSGWFWTK